MCWESYKEDIAPPPGSLPRSRKDEMRECDKCNEKSVMCPKLSEEKRGADVGIRESFMKKTGFELSFEQYVEIIKRGPARNRGRKS